MKKPLVVANWKLYVTARGDALAKARAVARGAKNVDAALVICPPTPFIEVMHAPLKRAGISLGAQTISVSGVSARTGEVTAPMVASLGVSYAIVGHSERRAMGEDENGVHERVMAALDAKLAPIVCVGEHTRDASNGDHFAVIENQLRSAFTQILVKDARRLVVAYEPVWAIGKTAADAMTAGELEETVIYIRKVLVELVGRAPALSIPILYGGSVEPANARELMESGVAGFLVGHASVEPQSLLAIGKAATEKNGTKKR